MKTDGHTSDDFGKDKGSSPTHGSVYRFREFVLDLRRRTLSRADSPVFITPKAFDVLSFLVQNPNRLVTKEELLKAVWGETFVEEGNLTQYISHLRKALGDNSEDTRLIVTIARKGYQFTANVTVGEEVDTKPPEVRVPPAESSGADARQGHEVPVKTAVPKPPGRWWKAGVVGLFAGVLFMFVGLVSWRNFGGTTPARPPKITLAVLPFENLTGDPNEEYLADGLTEEMISQLSRVNPEQLRVIARTSVMRYKHKDEGLEQIGRDLSVQYVLENSLRESNNHLRLTAQLIQVKDQTHLWSKDYDYSTKDILTVEDDVAESVAQEIRLRLTSQQQAKLGQSYPANPEAFDAYLQGFYFFQRNTDKDSEMAAKYYERATQLDSSYALAWVGLSRVRNWQVNIGVLPADEGHRIARQAVERALALNPNLAEAHAQMARIRRQVDLDWAGGDISNQRAIALAPGNPDILRAAAGSAETLGRFDDALRLGRRAAELDPLNSESWELFSEIELDMGQLDQALADSKKALELSADVWPGPILLSKIYLMQARPQDALREIELIRFEPIRRFFYPIVYHALGREKESDAALGDLIARYPDRPMDIARVYASRNESDKAFEWLDRSYAHRDTGLVQTKVDPLLKSLHPDPRFAALLKKLNFPT